MRYLMGLVVAGVLLLGTAGTSNAQFAVSIGNGFTGQGLYVGTPGYGYSNYGYSNYGLPGAYNYSSGYSGYVAPVAPISPYGYGGYGYGYGARPYYGPYGYRSYGYGYRNGFRPFGGMFRMFR
jgi:hypothetical protein